MQTGVAYFGTNGSLDSRHQHSPSKHGSWLADARADGGTVSGNHLIVNENYYRLRYLTPSTPPLMSLFPPLGLPLLLGSGLMLLAALPSLICRPAPQPRGAWDCWLACGMLNIAALDLWLLIFGAAMAFKLWGIHAVLTLSLNRLAAALLPRRRADRPPPLASARALVYRARP
ncbi:hypothetical protein [Sinimarinibacterium sp. NLF-5-8]|uniref:hypothetical protein n=1 Tax=Sinimarinibacterium sp. NLF-5-8 TaxID=2698684 RepID=UPI00137BE783|nr:hypothetical protein [Sinimarinibacterium sp. NLF-5-8]QHS08979.1 hypothetical protein GT972_01705 [Sinimarinibacterium sp. NLF-5-8]